MAVQFEVNGVGASIAPTAQTWRQILIGRDHTQRPIFSGNWEIDLMFQPASITFGQQWLDASSSGSANITVLNKYQTGFTDLSAVSMEITQPPIVTAGHFGDFIIVVRGASPQ